jgi:hypothetical protein
MGTGEVAATTASAQTSAPRRRAPRAASITALPMDPDTDFLL